MTAMAQWDKDDHWETICRILDTMSRRLGAVDEVHEQVAEIGRRWAALAGKRERSEKVQQMALIADDLSEVVVEEEKSVMTSDYDKVGCAVDPNFDGGDTQIVHQSETGEEHNNAVIWDESDCEENMFDEGQEWSAGDEISENLYSPVCAEECEIMYEVTAPVEFHPVEATAELTEDGASEVDSAAENDSFDMFGTGFHRLHNSVDKGLTWTAAKAESSTRNGSEPFVHFHRPAAFDSVGNDFPYSGRFSTVISPEFVIRDELQAVKCDPIKVKMDGGIEVRRELWCAKFPNMSILNLGGYVTEPHKGLVDMSVLQWGRWFNGNMRWSLFVLEDCSEWQYTEPAISDEKTVACLFFTFNRVCDAPITFFPLRSLTHTLPPVPSTLQGEYSPYKFTMSLIAENQIWEHWLMLTHISVTQEGKTGVATREVWLETEGISGVVDVLSGLYLTNGNADLLARGIFDPGGLREQSIVVELRVPDKSDNIDWMEKIMQFQYKGAFCSSCCQGAGKLSQKVRNVTVVQQLNLGEQENFAVQSLVPRKEGVDSMKGVVCHHAKTEKVHSAAAPVAKDILKTGGRIWIRKHTILPSPSTLITSFLDSPTSGQSEIPACYKKIKVLFYWQKHNVKMKLYLEVAQCLTEPAIAAVCHPGGGTVDISIVEISKGVFEVTATTGDTDLDREDFDNTILKPCVCDFNRTQSIYLSQNRLALQILCVAAKKVKAERSSIAQTEIKLPLIIGEPLGDFLNICDDNCVTILITAIDESTWAVLHSHVTDSLTQLSNEVWALEDVEQLNQEKSKKSEFTDKSLQFDYNDTLLTILEAILIALSPDSFIGGQSKIHEFYLRFKELFYWKRHTLKIKMHISEIWNMTVEKSGASTTKARLCKRVEKSLSGVNSLLLPKLIHILQHRLVWKRLHRLVSDLVTQGVVGLQDRSAQCVDKLGTTAWNVLIMEQLASVDSMVLCKFDKAVVDAMSANFKAPVLSDAIGHFWFGCSSTLSPASSYHAKEVPQTTVIDESTRVIGSRWRWHFLTSAALPARRASSPDTMMSVLGGKHILRRGEMSYPCNGPEWCGCVGR